MTPSVSRALTMLREARWRKTGSPRTGSRVAVSRAANATALGQVVAPSLVLGPFLSSSLSSRYETSQSKTCVAMVSHSTQGC